MFNQWVAEGRSFCGVVAGRGGAGAVAIAAGAVPGGGYGSGEVYVGVTSQPGSEVEVSDKGCKLRHGGEQRNYAVKDGGREINASEEKK